MKSQERNGCESKKIMPEDYLQRFLYYLMRDHVPTGIVAECVYSVAISEGQDAVFCNDHLAKMAYDYAERIVRASPTMGVDKGYMKLNDFNSTKNTTKE